MIFLSPQEIADIEEMLKRNPFSIRSELAAEVSDVLWIGNGKHGATNCDSVGMHLGHAARHFGTDGVDEETGCSHRAHGIARIILAIIEAGKNMEK
jgi:hypothetical protein